MLSIIQLSNTPNLVVSDVGTWFNEPKFEKEIDPNSFVDLKSDFFNPYSNVFNKDFLLHKLGHVVFYSLLTFMLYLNLKKYKLTLLICALFAMSDEMHQYYVVGRSGRMMDVLFDIIVCLLALLIIKKAVFVKVVPK